MSTQKTTISKSAQKFAENWLPVKSITNNAILLDDGLSVVGVKVSPKNIFILDDLSQESIIVGLRSFYNTLDYPFWLIVADRPVDINFYLSQLQLLGNSNNSPMVRKVIMQDIQKANTFMSKEIGVVDTGYYILFKEKRPEIIQKKLQNMITGLASCGLQATQATDEDLRDLLDNFLNDNTRYDFGTVITDEY